MQHVKLWSQNKTQYSFFMAIFRCPSLVGIPKPDPGNLMSVLVALWDHTLKRLVMISVYEQKIKKATTEIG